VTTNLHDRVRVFNIYTLIYKLLYYFKQTLERKKSDIKYIIKKLGWLLNIDSKVDVEDFLFLCCGLTWLFFSSSSSCLMRDLDHAFIFMNLASDLSASSVFCFDRAAKKKKKQVNEIMMFKIFHLFFYNKNGENRDIF